MARDSLVGREGSAKVGVVTILPEEMEAAQRILECTENIPGTPYFVRGGHREGPYDVILRQSSGRTNIPAFEAVRDLIEDFFPAYLLLVGIAGGIAGRDGIALGDLVIANYIEYSEFAKVVPGQVLRRREPYDHPSLFLRASIAEPLAKSGWREMIDVACPSDVPPKVLTGPIVAGEKVLGDPDNEYQRGVLEYFDHAIAVEMEAFGFARALFHARRMVHYNPQGLVVRSISDLVNTEANDETRKKWKLYASATAAAFASAVVNQLLRLP
jgi:nucleoside phosphorylase